MIYDKCSFHTYMTIDNILKSIDGFLKKNVPLKVTIFYHHPCSSGHLGAIWYPPISGQHPHLNQKTTAESGAEPSFTRPLSWLNLVLNIGCIATPSRRKVKNLEIWNEYHLNHSGNTVLSFVRYTIYSKSKVSLSNLSIGILLAV